MKSLGLRQPKDRGTENTATPCSIMAEETDAGDQDEIKSEDNFALRSENLVSGFSLNDGNQCSSKSSLTQHLRNGLCNGYIGSYPSSMHFPVAVSKLDNFEHIKDGTSDLIPAVSKLNAAKDAASDVTPAVSKLNATKDAAILPKVSHSKSLPCSFNRYIKKASLECLVARLHHRVDGKNHLKNNTKPSEISGENVNNCQVKLLQETQVSTSDKLTCSESTQLHNPDRNFCSSSSNSGSGTCDYISDSNRDFLDKANIICSSPGIAQSISSEVVNSVCKGSVNISCGPFDSSESKRETSITAESTGIVCSVLESATVPCKDPPSADLETTDSKMMCSALSSSLSVQSVGYSIYETEPEFEGDHNNDRKNGTMLGVHLLDKENSHYEKIVQETYINKCLESSNMKFQLKQSKINEKYEVEEETKDEQLLTGRSCITPDCKLDKDVTENVDEKLTASASTTPMFSNTPSESSQSEIMVKISDAVAAILSDCSKESNTKSSVGESDSINEISDKLFSSSNSPADASSSDINFSCALKILDILPEENCRNIYEDIPLSSDSEINKFTMGKDLPEANSNCLKEIDSNFNNFNDLRDIVGLKNSTEAKSVCKNCENFVEDTLLDNDGICSSNNIISDTPESTENHGYIVSEGSFIMNSHYANAVPDENNSIVNDPGIRESFSQSHEGLKANMPAQSSHNYTESKEEILHHADPVLCDGKSELLQNLSLEQSVNVLNSKYREKSNSEIYCKSSNTQCSNQSRDFFSEKYINLLLNRQCNYYCSDFKFRQLTFNKVDTSKFSSVHSNTVNSNTNKELKSTLRTENSLIGEEIKPGDDSVVTEGSDGRLSPNSFSNDDSLVVDSETKEIFNNVVSFPNGIKKEVLEDNGKACSTHTTEAEIKILNDDTDLHSSEELSDNNDATNTVISDPQTSMHESGDESKDLVSNKTSFVEFIQRDKNFIRGMCVLCIAVSSDLSSHSVEAHSCLSYIPIYQTDSFIHHMKERIGNVIHSYSDASYGYPHYICKCCGSLFKSMNAVRLHLNKHKDIYMIKDTSHLCECNKKYFSYPQQRYRKLLYQSVHVCSFCHFIFACKYGLTNHLKVVHFLNNTCIKCNKDVVSNTEVALLEHNNYHAGEFIESLDRPFEEHRELVGDQTHYSWNALDNHLNYLDGKIFRLEALRSSADGNCDRSYLALPLRVDPVFATVPENQFLSPAPEMVRYLKAKQSSYITGSDVDCYISHGLDLPVQLILRRRFTGKKPKRRNNHNKNNTIPLPLYLNLQNPILKKRSCIAVGSQEERTPPTRCRYARKAKTKVQRKRTLKEKQKFNNEENLLIPSRTRSGMQLKDTAGKERQEGEDIAHGQQNPTSEVSGEWVNYHTFVCCSCGAVFLDLAEIMDHKWEAHPGVWCAHTMIQGKNKVPKMFCDQYLPSHSRALFTEPKHLSSSQQENKEELICSQCKEKFETKQKFHFHIIDCGGLNQILNNRKKSKKGPRFKRRKGRGIPSRRYASNSLAPTPHKNSSERGSGMSTPNKVNKDVGLQGNAVAAVVKKKLDLTSVKVRNAELKSRLKDIITQRNKLKEPSSSLSRSGRNCPKIKMRKKFDQRDRRKTRNSEGIFIERSLENVKRKIRERLAKNQVRKSTKSKVLRKSKRNADDGTTRNEDVDSKKVNNDSKSLSATDNQKPKQNSCMKKTVLSQCVTVKSPAVSKTRQRDDNKGSGKSLDNNASKSASCKELNSSSHKEKTLRSERQGGGTRRFIKKLRGCGFKHKRFTLSKQNILPKKGKSDKSPLPGKLRKKSNRKMDIDKFTLDNNRDDVDNDPEEDSHSEPEVIRDFRQERLGGRSGLRTRKSLSSNRYSLRPSLNAAKDEGDDEDDDDSDEESIIRPRKNVKRKYNIGDDDDSCDEASNLNELSLYDDADSKNKSSPVVPLVKKKKYMKIKDEDDGNATFPENPIEVESKVKKRKLAATKLEEKECDLKESSTAVERQGKTVQGKFSTVQKKQTRLTRLCYLTQQRLSRLKVYCNNNTDSESSGFEGFFSRQKKRLSSSKNLLNCKRNACAAAEADTTPAGEEIRNNVSSRNNRIKSEGNEKPELRKMSNKQRRLSKTNERKYCTPEMIFSDFDSDPDDSTSFVALKKRNLRSLSAAESGDGAGGTSKSASCDKEITEVGALQLPVSNDVIPSKGKEFRQMLKVRRPSRSKPLLKPRKRKFLTPEIVESDSESLSDVPLSSRKTRRTSDVLSKYDLKKENKLSLVSDREDATKSEDFIASDHLSRRKSKRKENTRIAKKCKINDLHKEAQICEHPDNAAGTETYNTVNTIGACAAVAKLKPKRKYTFKKRFLNGSSEESTVLKPRSKKVMKEARVLSYKSLNTRENALPTKEAIECPFMGDIMEDKLNSRKMKKNHSKRLCNKTDENSPTIRKCKKLMNKSSQNDEHLETVGFLCSDCGLSFDSALSREDHQQDCRHIAFEMSLMAEDHLYECPYCQLTFALRGTQRKHISSCRLKKSKRHHYKRRTSNSQRKSVCEDKAAAAASVSNPPPPPQGLKLLNLCVPLTILEEVPEKAGSETDPELELLARRLASQCQERIGVKEICALLLQYQLCTNDLRCVLTPTSCTQDANAITRLNLRSLYSLTPTNNGSNYLILHDIIKQLKGKDLFSDFNIVRESRNRNLVRSEDNVDDKTDMEIAVNVPKPELLKALAIVEEILKEAASLDLCLKKQQMLVAMKHTFQAGTDS